MAKGQCIVCPPMALSYFAFFNQDILNVTAWSFKDLFTPRLYQKFTYCKLFLVLHWANNLKTDSVLDCDVSFDSVFSCLCYVCMLSAGTEFLFIWMILGGLAQSSYSDGLSLAKPSFSPELISNIFHGSFLLLATYVIHEDILTWR